MDKNFFLALAASFILIISCKNDKDVIVNGDKILQVSQDAVFSKIVPENNYGNTEDIHLYAWTQSGVINVNRVAISFDLLELPTGAIIDSAFISVYFNSTSRYLGLNPEGHSGENSFLIQTLTEEWEESNVTWDTQPNSSMENQILVENSDDPTQDYTNIDVSPLISGVNFDQYYGFLLRHQFEDPYKVTFLASSEHPTGSIRPTLHVYYHTIE